MASGKTEFGHSDFSGKTVEKPKKSRRRRLLLWLLIDLVVAAIVIGLLIYKPAHYNPVAQAAGAGADGDRVHPYITHDLMPTLYNGAQDRRPFEMVVLDQGLNEAIAQTEWFQQSGGIQLRAPAIAFAPGRVILMGTADIEGANFVVSIELGPQMTEDGRLNLRVEKVKVGAMNVTLLARMVARRMYQERIDIGGIDTDDWRAKIAASLLVEEPFEPIFPVEDKWVRVQSFDISQGKLIAQLVPVKQTRK
jgi:hypothetical protein